MGRVLILILCVLTMAGCKKELSYKYAFNLNGTAYRGDTYTASYDLDTVAGLREFVADFYIGKITDTNYVQVSFSGNNYVTPGTYYSGILNPGNTLCSFAYVNHVYYTNITGIVQISQIDTVARNLSGSFQFKAVSNANSADSVVVTNGGFSGVNYIIQ
jgi:hypothetical protein